MYTFVTRGIGCSVKVFSFSDFKCPGTRLGVDPTVGVSPSGFTGIPSIFSRSDRKYLPDEVNRKFAKRRIVESRRS